MQFDRTRMYRVAAVADALDISKATVYRAIESGALDSARFGKAIRIPGHAIATWVDECGEDAYRRHVQAGESAEDLDAAEDGGVHA